MKKNKTITVSNRVHKKLTLIKVKHDHSTLDNTLTHVLKTYDAVHKTIHDVK